jgi:hypothetical protein
VTNEPVIPDFGQASSCVTENRFFCTDWVRDNWGPVLQPRLIEHIELVLIAVSIGFVISLAAALLAHRLRLVERPIAFVSAVIYTIPSLALFQLLVPLTGFLLFHTRAGLQLQAVGEHPHAAETLGISVRTGKIERRVIGLGQKPDDVDARHVRFFRPTAGVPEARNAHRGVSPCQLGPRTAKRRGGHHGRHRYDRSKTDQGHQQVALDHDGYNNLGFTGSLEREIITGISFRVARRIPH